MGQTEDEWAKERESYPSSHVPRSGICGAHYESCIEERVKFFRDEADMERWREQVEIKHAEFARVIRAFRKYREIWTALAISTSSPSLGHAAYAYKVAARYMLMEVEACEHFKICGIPILREIKEGRTLADHILAWRAEETQRFPKVDQ